MPVDGAVAPSVDAGAHADVVAALRGMGFNPSEIATRLAALPRDQALSAEEALRLALRQAEPR